MKGVLNDSLYDAHIVHQGERRHDYVFLLYGKVVSGGLSLHQNINLSMPDTTVQLTVHTRKIPFHES